MLGAISNMCMAEIFYWLKKGGLTDEDFQSFIKSSQNYSTALDRITQIMIGRKFKPRKSWMPKDVGFGLDEARAMEVPVPFSSLAYQMFTLAQANGVDGYCLRGLFPYEWRGQDREVGPTIREPIFFALRRQAPKGNQ